MVEHEDRTTLAAMLRSMPISLNAETMIVRVRENNWNVTEQSFFVTSAIARLRFVIFWLSLSLNEGDVFSPTEWGYMSDG